MTQLSPACWRYADLGGNPSEAGGPQLTPAGGIALARDDEAVRQSIMMLLATIPGERVMRPEYGCPLHRVVFDPNDDTTAGLAIHYVRQAILRFEPRIEILRLDAGAQPSLAELAESAAGRLYVRLDYRVRATQRDDSLALSVDLAGGAA
jgi:phage baseplate assembly protein W